MQTIRVGVIGAGGRGGIAEHAHRPDQGSRLVAAADLDPGVLRTMKEKYGDDLYVTDDYRALLAQKDVDAVIVASPDFLHEEHAALALSAGKHTYCEKPLAITVEGCDRILTAARNHGVRLFVGHNMRYMAFVQTMKRLVDDGRIGRITTAWCRHFVGYGGDAYFKDWHSERRLATGLLLQKGSHDIDVMHWIAGAYTRRVTALGALSVYDKCHRRSAEDKGVARFDEGNWPPLSQKNLSPVIDVEDQSMMLMELSNGVQGCYLQCHFTPDSWRNYTFIGTEGRIENVGDFGARCEVHVYTRRTDRAADPTEIVSIDEGGEAHGGADPKIIADFLEHVRTGAKTLASPVAARYSVAAGFQATVSLRNGGIPMDVPQLDPALARYFEQG
jgi:predicted dehydrogenase